MPKLAQFDPGAPSPQPIIGWYDTDSLSYPNLPPDSALLALTEDEWAIRLDDPSGWTNSNGVLTAAVPPPPSLGDQARLLMAAGLGITSKGTSALNGVYSCDDVSQQRIMAETISLLQNGTFADGSDTIDWADASGAMHEFSIASFQAFNTKIAGFVAACVAVISSNSGALPASTAAIP